MEDMNQSAQPTTTANLAQKIDEATALVGALVPAVGAIGGIVRIIAKAARPSDARKAQAFDEAILALDSKLAGLNEAIAGFEAAKAAAQGQ